ncbi:hypothetical protein GCM10017744_048080 [Streptomyces antimycoticus]|uniref:DUF4229 domain-containing protein n=2 Tax=Streptomyces violaceusniger group TaxID=2839105 RepID=A0A4D4K8I5_9ACTN|nr:hypothetical protein SANT12839_054240 [Streptomyces antimycoticus]SEC38210.1 Protein of unknown function [Streptomyces melanosporofaciens]
MVHWEDSFSRHKLRQNAQQNSQERGRVVSFTPSAMFRYTLMRLGIFVGSFLVIWGLVYVRVLPSGLGSSNLFWVALLALVVSAPLSWVMLRRQRDAVAVQVAEKVDRAKERLAANQSQEDGV